MGPFAVWDGDEASWDLQQVTEEIVADLEGAVPARLREEGR